jgi:transposase
MERRSRKKYTTELKLEAIRLSNESGKPITQVARDLNIPAVLLYRWRDEIHRDGAKAFPGKGKKTNVSPEKLELERLRRENKRLQDERDILKKLWFSWLPKKPKIPIKKGSGQHFSL